MSASDRARHASELRREQEAGATESSDQTEAEEQVRQRLRRQASSSQWVEIQIQRAINDGEFENLPSAGKPIPGIDRPHDPDWWLKKLVERERLSVLPPALALRTEDARLDDELDRIARVEDIRDKVEDFNQRIVEARRQLQGGPPVITPLRDVDAEVAAWQRRRNAKVAEQKRVLAEIRAREERDSAPSWWRRLGLAQRNKE